jgi:hypothetical protein
LLNKHRSSLDPLIRDIGIEDLTGIIKNLLNRGVFQSEVKAKIEFPNFFLSSPARDEQRTASENDAARSAAEALAEIESLDGHPHELDNKEGIPMIAYKPKEIPAGELLDFCVPH